MRHRLPGNQLARPADQRKAVLRALATELIRHDEIVTTLAKAKAVRSHAEKLITLAKRYRLENHKELYEKAKQGDAEAAKKVARAVHARRRAATFLFDKDVVKKLFDETAGRYQSRPGGYTRILKTGMRRGDASPMAIIQLV